MISKKCHLLVPDLFLPQEFAGSACDGLSLPTLEKLLARAQSYPLSEDTLESSLCTAFGVAGLAIAPVTLRADGGQPGAFYWMRADPVHVQITRDQMILRADITLTADEATLLCATLNEHFVEDGLCFIAPHPQRWYLRLNSAPDLITRPLAQVAGRNIHAHLAQGEDALYWNGVFNEIQMLFHDHPVNQARQARGGLAINSVWLWGGGHLVKQLAQPYTRIYGDSELAKSFAHAADSPYEAERFAVEGKVGSILVVSESLRHTIQHGDLLAWRDAVQRLENVYVSPLWQALRKGYITQITLDVPGAGSARRFVLARNELWKLWHLPKSLTHYALV